MASHYRESAYFAAKSFASFMGLHLYLGIVLLSSCVISCSPPTTSTAAAPPVAAPIPATSPPVSPSNTLGFRARSTFEISEVIQRHDTLLIVSGSQAIAHPLGQVATATAFLARYPGFSLTARDEDPDSTGAVRVYTATRGTSSVRLFKPAPGAKWLAVASGTLTDPQLLLATGVHVGMSKQEFLNTFFTVPLALPAQPVNTLALVYVVDSEMQYCHLRQGVIDKIELASVYTVQ